MTPQLWDFAGIDGLQMAKALFGEAIDRIAVFQSIDTSLSDCPCSVLRLCETNFRVVGYNKFDLQLVLQQATIDRRVWLRQFHWLDAIVLPDSLNSQLPDLAMPKLPHRLPLPLNCAAPARINSVSVLIWRHLVNGQAAIELHTATRNLPLIQTQLVAIADQQTSFLSS
ncbi:MAG: hypothetical protein F6K28_55635 [Microcoleus sp. SIO2G3]|nr:hypothetical protein [Microcoleus sp. SIO2G3]